MVVTQIDTGSTMCMYGDETRDRWVASAFLGRLVEGEELLEPSLEVRRMMLAGAVGSSFSVLPMMLAGSRD